MASSQVEIASPSSPFGCVLRDHNRCSRKNLKDYLHSCISTTDSENNSNRSLFDLHADWLPTINNNNVNVNTDHHNHHKRSKIIDRWAKAREMVFPADKQTDNLTVKTNSFQREISPAQSDCSVEIPNLGGVSSLVRKWKDFEADAKNNVNNNSNNTVNSSPVSSRSNSGSIFTENSAFIDERCETSSVLIEDTFPDWESDKTAPSGPPSCRSSAAEREKLRVADIIKKLSSEEQAGNESLARIRTKLDQQQQAFTPVIISSPRLIRGRQAFADLLMQMEQDKHRELEGLVEKKAVSRFSHRGRIQALLRVRFLRSGAETKSHRRTISKTLEANRLNIMHLRDKFSAGVEQGAADSRNHNREVIKNTPDVENPSTSTQVREVVVNATNAERMNNNQLMEEVNHPEISESRSPRRKVHHQETSNSRSPRRSRREVYQQESSDSRIPHREVHHQETGDSRSPFREVHHQESSDSESPRQQVHRQETSDSRSPRREVVDNTPDIESCSTSMRLEEDAHSEYANTTTRQRTAQVNNSENRYEEACQFISDVICQGAQDSTHAKTSLNGIEEKMNAEERVSNKQQPIGSGHEWVNDISHIPSDWGEQNTSNSQVLESCHDWISDFSQTRSEWAEQEFIDQQLLDDNYDWISDIARPRSDWEGLRQARYQEMLDPFSENGEIRLLLERRSVSSFLSSGMRERIDQLMVCRAQRQPPPMDIQVKRLEQEVREEGKAREETMEVVEEDHDDEECQGEEDEDGENGDDVEVNEDEEDDSRIERQCSEYSEDIDQTSCHEVNDYSDQFASPCLQPSISSTHYSQNNQQCSSFTSHPSIEMEFIYDLRGQMEQLHQEIMELRKSIKSCVNMQVKLQRSFKQEVAAAVSHSVRREGKESPSMVPGRRSCCVCREVQVDSLLYRCGHMCTCFKCAHELQWSSGKCPICQAPIVDVVRAYAHDR